jgi:hypothetical protein
VRLLAFLTWIAVYDATLLLVLALAAGAQAMVLVVTAPGWLPSVGYPGNPVEQVVSWTVSSVLFTSPVSLLVGTAAAIATALLSAAIGRFRIAAVSVAIVTVGAIGAAAGAPPDTLAVALGVAAAFGAVLPSPRGFGPIGVARGRHAVAVGLGLSAIWLVGPVLAVVGGVVLVRRGLPREAGRLLAAATALPLGLLFGDLFRDHVPPENHVVVALLALAFGSGIALIVQPDRPAPGTRPA